jgi:hypothetical protein
MKYTEHTEEYTEEPTEEHTEEYIEQRILTKEEYDDLLDELEEYSIIFLKKYWDYKTLLKRMPNAYNDTKEDLEIYREIFDEIDPDELLEKQYQTLVNINNYFEENYAIIKKEIKEIIKINKKYNNKKGEAWAKEMHELGKRNA